MILKVHRSQSANLKLFLDTLGFVSVWDSVGYNIDILNVLRVPDSKVDFLQTIQNELKASGYVGYHLSLSPVKQGKASDLETGDRVCFEGNLTQAVAFKNISGDFNLLLFEDGLNNYVWKSYKTESLPPPQRYLVTGKMKANLKGLNGENLILFNYVRLKDV